MLDKKIKERIIKKFSTHASDTGSTQVQVAILTEEIKQLTEHLKIHKKDFSTRRGLLRKVTERRRLLKYFLREDPAEYDKLILALKLKTPKPELDQPTEVMLAAESAEGLLVENPNEATETKTEKTKT